MAKFRKKPVVIDAWQYTPTDIENLGKIPRWLSGDKITGKVGCSSLFIETLEGTMEVKPEDWIIRGVKRELYSCKPDIFALTYEPVKRA